MKSVGLVGARGYTGRELIELIERHPSLELAFASSREWDGKPVAEMVPGASTSINFEALDPAAVAAQKADVVVLGMPNGKAGPFVEAIDAGSPDTVVVDLSADFRFQPGWTYGLPERDRSELPGAKRIANPGCYATAAQLALLPLAPLATGHATVFGVSGYSGAGTTPSRKNDARALRDNIIPYAPIGHGHEGEIATGTGLDVHFMPSVAAFFRSLIVTCDVTLAEPTSEDEVMELYADRYAGEPMVKLLPGPAEPAAVANSHHCHVGRPAVQGTRVVVTAALDNLLKGAASQAMQNVNLALGFEELAGLRPD